MNPSDVLAAVAPQLQDLAAREANRAAAQAEADVMKKLYVTAGLSIVLGGLLGWQLAKRLR